MLYVAIAVKMYQNSSGNNNRKEVPKLAQNCIIFSAKLFSPRPPTGEGLCPPQLGVWGKIILRKKNYAILSKFWYFFPIIIPPPLQSSQYLSPTFNLTPTPLHRPTDPQTGPITIHCAAAS